MRVGKTAQAGAACGFVGAERVLVLGPASARAIWPREWKRLEASGYFPFGTPALQFRSYTEIARRGSLDDLRDWEPDTTIIDEAHRCKSPSALQTQKVLGHRKEVGLVRGPRVWALSGTPAPNDPSELYTVCARFWPRAVHAAAVGSLSRWRERYCSFFERRTSWGSAFRITGAKNEDELRRFLFDEGRMLRRTFEQVAEDLSPLNWGTEWVESTPSVLRELAQLEGWSDAALSLALEAEELPRQDEHIMRARRLIGIFKAQRLAPDLLWQFMEGAFGEKLVVIAWHREALDVLQGTFESTLGASRVTRIDGSTSPAIRERNLQRFQTDPDCRVFVGQLQACKEAIDLSAADHMALVEAAWSPGDNKQVGNRLRNPDKHRPCFVTTYGLTDSFDEPHAKLIANKATMLGAIDLG
jgi:SNF2 family DNA or RNA helicase